MSEVGSPSIFAVFSYVVELVVVFAYSSIVSEGYKCNVLVSRTKL